MNYEIKKEDWANFFNDLSKRRYEWKTNVEVLSPEMGDQILTDGLPFNGVTLEEEDGEQTIVISVGENTENHQAHSIKSPVRVAFLATPTNRDEVLDIEETNGTKTLIRFVEPMGVITGYFAEMDMIATAG